MKFSSIRTFIHFLPRFTSHQWKKALTMILFRCYECGDTGHLSYSCPSNLLGNREPPKKKSKKRKKEAEQNPKKSLKTGDSDEEADEEEENFEDESLGAAIRYQVGDLYNLTV